MSETGWVLICHRSDCCADRDTYCRCVVLYPAFRRAVASFRAERRSDQRLITGLMSA